MSKLTEAFFVDVSIELRQCIKVVMRLFMCVKLLKYILNKKVKENVFKSLLQ